MVTKTFSERLDIKSVMSFGGWGILEAPDLLIKGLEQTVIKSYCALTGDLSATKFNISEKISCLDQEEYSALFDMVNMNSFLARGQNIVEEKFLDPSVMGHPLMWTYPNFRVDSPAREKYQSPAHCDDWISFRGKSSLIFWLPIFSDGYLDVSEFVGSFRVEKNDYWGLAAKDESSFKWKTQKILKGKILVFRSDLLHRSSGEFGSSMTRFSVQYRFEDFAFLERPFHRAVSQKISSLISDKQTKLANNYYSNIDENI